MRAEWDRILGFSLVGLGAVFVVLAYFGVSDSPYLAEQLSFITSGGIGGLFLLGAGATLLHAADVHDEWRKLDQIEEFLREQAKQR
jgi:multisubunit Na+/H+ antiporter MnhB subunit